MFKLSTRNRRALSDVATKLQIPEKWLETLIWFESGFNPRAKNPVSSARGLIQFINSTAVKLGYRDSLDLVKKNPTIEKQLRNPVYKYLKQFAPFPTDQSLFMSVFYPKARYWNPKREFPVDPVQLKNPGIKTPEDYVKKVYRAGGLRYVPPLMILLSVGILAFFLSREMKGGRYGGNETTGGGE